MIYLLLAILLLLAMGLIYYSYKKRDDSRWLLNTLLYLLAAVFFTYISKVIFVHKPIFIVHLAFVMLSWTGLFLYLIKNRLHLWMIFAPIASTVLFFAMALFFRENA